MSLLTHHSDIDQIKQGWHEIKIHQPKEYKYLKSLERFFAEPAIPVEDKYITACAMLDTSIQEQDNKKYIYLINKGLMDLEKIKVYNTKLGKRLELLKLKLVLCLHTQDAEIIN